MYEYCYGVRVCVVVCMIEAVIHVRLFKEQEYTKYSNLYINIANKFAAD